MSIEQFYTYRIQAETEVLSSLAPNVHSIIPGGHSLIMFGRPNLAGRHRSLSRLERGVHNLHAALNARMRKAVMAH